MRSSQEPTAALQDCRSHSPVVYRWLKTNVSETGAFVITGFAPREAVAVAELRHVSTADTVGTQGIAVLVFRS